MNVNCKDRDRIFADGTPEEWVALEIHAGTCAACSEELRAWRNLSTAAAELRDYSDAPTLWPRIERALTEEAARNAQRGRWWDLRWLLPAIPLWQAAALAAAVLLLVIVPLARLRFQPGNGGRVPPKSEALLRNKALDDVERAESAYVQAIDKLALEAKPQLDNPETPLMANYREKLLVLDSAINDLQAQAGQNPSNAHLRYQLLAMYQEKQRTLEEVLEEKR